MFVARGAGAWATAPRARPRPAHSPAAVSARPHPPRAQPPAHRRGGADEAGARACARLPSPPSSRTCPRRRWPGWPRCARVAPAAEAVARLPGPGGREGAFRTLRRALRAACRDRVRADQLARSTPALLPGILKTATPRLRRQGAASRGHAARRWRRLGSAAAACPACSNSACRCAARSASSWRARPRRRVGAPAGAAEPAPRRHPGGDAGAGTRTSMPRWPRRPVRQAGAHRRGDGLRRRAVRRVLRAATTARWWPTRWRRGRTTPATTASTPATCRSSNCRCARSTGLPLVTPRLHSPAVMLNLLGDLWFCAGQRSGRRARLGQRVLAVPGAHLHLYGKAEPRPGRKMGHLTITGGRRRSAPTRRAARGRRAGPAAVLTAADVPAMPGWTPTTAQAIGRRSDALAAGRAGGVPDRNGLWPGGACRRRRRRGRDLRRQGSARRRTR